MPQVTRMTAEQRADLVAYLDGELADEEASAIEQVLASSEVARHEVEALGQTWNLLDALPRETASAEFATKTLEKLQGQPVPRADTSQWRRYCLLIFGYATTLIAVAVLGFAIGQRWLPREDTAYVEHLPVLDRLDDYRNVGSVEFLKELEQNSLRFQPPEGSR